MVLPLHRLEGFINLISSPEAGPLSVCLDPGPSCAQLLPQLGVTAPGPL